MITAVQENVPLIIIPMDRWSHSYSNPADPEGGIGCILDDLPKFLKRLGKDCPPAKDFLGAGIDVNTIGDQIKEALTAAITDSKGNPRMSFNSQGSRSQLEAQMGQLACALVKEANPANYDLVDQETGQLLEFIARQKAGTPWCAADRPAC